MFGYFLITDSTPLLRSVSTDVPATPVTITTLPFPCNWVARNWPPSCPNLNWSVLTVRPHFSVTTLSNEMTRIPRAHACLTMPFNPVGDAASDRKSTRLNSSHTVISYAVFCLKNKTDASEPPFQTHGASPPLPGRKQSIILSHPSLSAMVFRACASAAGFVRVCSYQHAIRVLP